MTSRRGISSRKRAFVRALVDGLTVAEAAAQVGVSSRTGARYYSDPQVKAALRAAEDAALGVVVRRLGDGCDQALDTLSDVMSDPEMAGGVRVRAAESWLSHCFRARELLDLAGRLTEVEGILSSKGR